MVNTASSSNSVHKKTSLSNKKKLSNLQGASEPSSSKTSTDAIDATYSHLGYSEPAPEQSYSTLNRIQPSSPNAYRENESGPYYDVADQNYNSSYSTLGPRGSAPGDHSTYNTLDRSQIEAFDAAEYPSSHPENTGYFESEIDLKMTVSQSYQAHTPMVMHQTESSTYNTLSGDRESNTVSSVYSTLDRSAVPEDLGAYSTLHSQTPANNPATDLYNHVQAPSSHMGEALPPKLVVDRSTKPKLRSYEQVSSLSQTPAMHQSYDPATLHGLQFAPDEDL